MTIPASRASDQALSSLEQTRGMSRAPLFAHRPVGWRQHSRAVLVAALVSSTTQTGVGMFSALTGMRMTGASLGPHPAIVVAVTTVMLWIPLFLVVLAELAIGFTVARAALTRARRNLGAAYLAIGLTIGMLEAMVIGGLATAAAPRNYVFAAAIGVLGGFVYWLSASRNPNAMTREERARIAATFG